MTAGVARCTSAYLHGLTGNQVLAFRLRLPGFLAKEGDLAGGSMVILLLELGKVKSG